MKAIISTHFSKGFNLLELLVTILILSIFLAIAVPSFNAVTQNNTIATISNDFTIALKMARSEAIKRNLPVSVCAAADQNYNACGNNWDLGWLIFVNPTGGTTISNTTDAPLVRIRENNNHNISFTTSPNVNIVTFNGSGFPAPNTGIVNFTIKATGCTTDSGRQITLSVTGNTMTTYVSCP